MSEGRFGVKVYFFLSRWRYTVRTTMVDKQYQGLLWGVITCMMWWVIMHHVVVFLRIVVQTLILGDEMCRVLAVGTFNSVCS